MNILKIQVKYINFLFKSIKNYLLKIEFVFKYIFILIIRYKEKVINKYNKIFLIKFFLNKLFFGYFKTH